MRRHRCDLLEVYGGFANISIEGIKQGLKVAQPIDKVHGVAIETKADHEHLRQLLRRHRPFLTVWEIRCDPWSHIQHLNYTAEQLKSYAPNIALIWRRWPRPFASSMNWDAIFFWKTPGARSFGNNWNYSLFFVFLVWS